MSASNVVACDCINACLLFLIILNYTKYHVVLLTDLSLDPYNCLSLERSFWNVLYYVCDSDVHISTIRLCFYHRLSRRIIKMLCYVSSKSENFYIKFMAGSLLDKHVWYLKKILH